MFDRFVGVPYRDRGRDFDGADCWGLLWLVYRDLRGIELPSYSERYVTASDRKAMAALIAAELDPWQPVAEPDARTFDGVLMKQGGFPRHIGVVTSPGMMLHVEQGRASCIERYRSSPIVHRVVGFYRYREHE